MLRKPLFGAFTRTLGTAVCRKCVSYHSEPRSVGDYPSPVFDLCPIRSPVQADAQLYKTALYDLHLKLQGKVSNARSLSSDVLVDVIPAQPGTVFSLTVGPGLVSAHL